MLSIFTIIFINILILFYAQATNAYIGLLFVNILYILEFTTEKTRRIEDKALFNELNTKISNYKILISNILQVLGYSIQHPLITTKEEYTEPKIIPIHSGFLATEDYYNRLNKDNLHNNLKLFEDSFLSHPEIQFIIDLEGRLVRGNRVFFEFLNTNKLNFNDFFTFAEQLNPISEGKILNLIKEKKKTSIPVVSCTYSKLLNKTYDVCAVTVGENYLIVARDITPYSFLADSIKLHKFHLENILNTVPNLIYLKNNGKFTLVNKAFLSFIGEDSINVISKTAEEVFSLDHPWYYSDKDEDTLQYNRKTIMIETINDHVFETIRIPFDIMHNKEILCVATDITSLIKTNEELQKVNTKLSNLNKELEERVKKRTEQLENINYELDAFVYSVSHDLKNPLRQISRFAAKQDFSSINRKVEELDQLIDGLLRLSDIGSKPDRAEVDITEMIKSITKNIEGNIEIEEGMMCFCDAQMAYSLFLNLIDNSIKFSKPEGLVLKVYKVDNTFVVCDQGIGFSMEAGDAIFNPFKKLGNTDGTGIGLSTVKRIINRHGGSIRYESSPNKGTCFYLTFC